MAIWITFQGPDFNQARWGSARWTDEQPSFRFEGFDLDYMSLTVYPPDEEMDTNLTLAKPGEYQNENGDECGEIGWVIDPETALLDAVPSLAEFIGRRYGRIIVTSVDINEREQAMQEQARLAEREEAVKRERDVKIQQSREDLRRAITHYETLLDVAQSTEKDDKEQAHLAHSLTEVRSAKRVLWFEN
jgi:hypothetical protein